VNREQQAWLMIVAMFAAGIALLVLAVALAIAWF
jgi:hypothetical protein